MMHPLYNTSWIICLCIRLSLIVFICLCYDYIVLISSMFWNTILVHLFPVSQTNLMVNIALQVYWNNVSHESFVLLLLLCVDFFVLFCFFSWWKCHPFIKWVALIPNRRICPLCWIHLGLIATAALFRASGPSCVFTLASVFLFSLRCRSALLPSIPCVWQSHYSFPSAMIQVVPFWQHLAMSSWFIISKMLSVLASPCGKRPQSVCVPQCQAWPRLAAYLLWLSTSRCIGERTHGSSGTQVAFYKYKMKRLTASSGA